MRLRNRLFQITIKTPIVAILLVLLVFSSLLFIIFSGEIAVYAKYDGEILNNKEELLFKIYPTTSFSELSKETVVIWYVANDDKRYDGKIISLDKENNAVIIKNTSKIKSYNSINAAEKVFIELSVGKTKIYKRLFSKVM